MMPYVDDIDWSVYAPNGCDVLHWIPFMTADDLGLDYPKWIADRVSGACSVSIPSGHEESNSSKTHSEVVAA